MARDSVPSEPMSAPSVPVARTPPKRATRSATARSTKAARKAAAAGSEVTPPELDGAPDAHL